MKVSKAIEILNYNLKTYPHLEHEDFGVAIKLGIEALKRCQENRSAHRDHLGQTLPGETPEEEVIND